MKILSLYMENFRVHRKLKVDFSAGLNLIGGANESGKTTVLQALQFGLFASYSTRGELLKNLQSVHSDELPLVRIEFELDGVKWLLEKKLATSMSLLSQHGKLTNQAAQERLNELLAVQPCGRFTVPWMNQQWQNLLSFQGLSGEDPKSYILQQLDDLNSGLQAKGVATLALGAFDQSMQEGLQQRYLEYFTDTKASKKKNARPALLQNQLDEEALKLADLEQKRESLQQNVKKAEQSQQQIGFYEDALARERVNLQQTEQQVELIKHLQQQLEAAQNALQLQQTLHQAITARLQGYRKSERNLQDYQQRAIELQQLLAQLEPVEQQQRQRENQLELTLQQQQGSLDALSVQLQQLDKQKLLESLSQQLGGLQQQSRQRQQQLKQRDELLRQLAALPIIKPKDYKQLHEDYIKNCGMQQSILNMGMSVELLEGRLQVQLDGQALQVGQSKTLVEDGELCIDGSTRLRLRMGRDAGLQQMRNEQSELQRSLQQRYQRYGVEQFEQLAEKQTQRRDLENRKAGLEQALQAYAANLDEQLQQCEAELAVIKEELENLPAVETERAELQRQLRQARQQADETGVELRQMRELLQQSAREMERYSQQQVTVELDIQRSRQEMEQQLQTDTLQQLEQQQLQQGKDCQEQQQQLAELERQLQALDPQVHLLDQKRLQQSISASETYLQQNRDNLVSARAVLNQMGGDNLEERYLVQAEKCRRVAEKLAGELLQQDALALLKQKFDAVQQQINETLNAPFGRIINDYTRLIFGRESDVECSIDRQAKNFSLDLRRDGQAIDFSQLSGGAREQLAAGVRLAFAETLCAQAPQAGKERCLPVVFDDAFVNSDFKRQEGVKRLLSLAAERGLQVIVLSCHAESYTGLAANHVML